ncbi:MAG: fluoride efflux transporter CrcB [Prevotella sp.]
MLKNIILVAVGGAVGSVLRYLLSKIVQESTLSSFPFGTMTVNVLGCLALGIIYGMTSDLTVISREVRLLLAVGFCGGLTTFSTFMNETLCLLRAEHIISAAIYVGVSATLGLLAVYIGSMITKIL